MWGFDWRVEMERIAVRIAVVLRNNGRASILLLYKVWRLRKLEARNILIGARDREAQTIMHVMDFRGL